MKLNFDIFNRANAPKMFVCNPDNTKLEPITRYTDLEPKPTFNAVSEASLKVYKKSGLKEKDVFVTKSDSITGTNIIIDKTASTISSLNIKGKSQQTVTVQEKNISPVNSVSINVPTTGTIGGTTGTVIVKNIYVQPNTSYTLSFISTFTMTVITYQSSKTNTSHNSLWSATVGASAGTEHGNITSPMTITTGANEHYIAITTGNLSNVTSGVYSASNIQLELGSTSTAYEPFVPNSPSPDYPAPITPTNKVTVNGTDYTIPDGYSLPNGKYDIYDLITGAGTKNVGKAVLNGSEPAWTFAATVLGDYIGFYSHLANGKIYGSGMCAQFPTGDSNDWGTRREEFVWPLDEGGSVCVRINKNRLTGWSDSWTSAQKVTAFKSWLAANPVTVLYELATPTAITSTPQQIPTNSLLNISNNTSTSMTVAYNYREVETQILPTELDQNCYKWITNHRQIHIENLGYFLITQVEENTDGVDPYKSVELTSCEMEINNKLLVLTAGTYKFYDELTPLQTIMGKIMSMLPTWTIGNIPNTVKNKYRTFDYTSQNAYGFMSGDMQNAYECICDFDIENRVINFIDDSTEIASTGIYLSHDDVINNIQITTKEEDIITALTVSGSNNLTIRDVNPLGTDTIYKFDYFKTTDWMSQNLIDAINAWETKITSKETEHANLVLTLQTKNAELNTLSGELSNLNAALKALIQQKSVASSSEFNTIQAQIVAKQAEIASKNAEITSKNAEITATTSQLSVLQNSLSFESNFTTEQYKTLTSCFILVKEYSDENITITDTMTYAERIAQAQELYNKAKIVLDKKAEPRYETTVDCENFLAIKDFNIYRNQLALGKFINVEVSKDNVSQLMLLQYDMTYDSDGYPDKLNLSFSNRMRLHDTLSKYADTYSNTTNSASIISNNKAIWDYPMKDGKFQALEDFRQGTFNASYNEFISSDKEEVKYDQTGILLRAYDDVTDTYDQNQMWLTHGGILISHNGFTSADGTGVAIGKMTLPNGTTTYGINADFILAGKINANLITAGKIQSADGKVYFDLDNSVGAFNKLISTEDGATDVYAKIGIFNYEDGATAKGFGLYSSDSQSLYKDFAAFSQTDKDALNNVGLEIATSGTIMLRSTPVYGNDTKLFLYSDINKKGYVELWRSRGGTNSNTLVLNVNPDNLNLVQDFSNDNSNIGGLYIDTNGCTVKRQFGTDNYGGLYIDTTTNIHRQFSSTNWGQFKLAPDFAGIYSNGTMVAKFTNTRTDIYSSLYVQGVQVTSDRDKKCNIESVSIIALDKIKDMKFYSYNLKSQESDDVIRMASITGYEGTEEIAKNDGIINQPTSFTYSKPLTGVGSKVDIGVMYDEAPTEIQSSDTDNKGINLYEYVSLTAKAIQELNEKMISKDNEIQGLKDKIEKLEEKIIV